MIDHECAHHDNTKIGIYFSTKYGWTVTLTEDKFKRMLKELDFETLEEFSRNWTDYKSFIDDEIMKRLSM